MTTSTSSGPVSDATGAAPRPPATSAAKAALLRSLHRPGDPLLLPNAWDAASAQVVVEAGFPALATGSLAVAAALGYPDGEQAPMAETLAAVARIARNVEVPVTADFENGYGLSADELVRALAGTGAVGFNIEDTDPATGRLVDPDVHAERLAAIRTAARAAGVDLVVNARVDSFITAQGPTAERLADAVRRARAYVAAGADCVYPILTPDAETAHSFIEQVDAPVNLLCHDGGPGVRELAGLGAARISFGPGIFRIAMAAAASAVAAVRELGDPFAGGA